MNIFLTNAGVPDKHRGTLEGVLRYCGMCLPAIRPMPEARLELAHPKALAPKASVSTNFTTPAQGIWRAGLPVSPRPLRFAKYCGQAPWLITLILCFLKNLVKNFDFSFFCL